MKHLQSLIMTVIPMLTVMGCGGNGASNNDQGVSVTLLGLFQTAPAQANNGGGGNNGNQGNGVNLTGCGGLPQPLAGSYISLGQTMPQVTATPNSSQTANGLWIDPAGSVYAIVGLQNNLSGQVFRADRILLEYYIPGSSVQPPSTNVALNMLAGPAEAGTQGGTGGAVATPVTSIRRPIVTSLPPSFNQICNRAFAQVPIIPAPIREWLIFNSNQLPEAPFDLEIVITLTGLSSGGNRYDTNQGLFSISVVPEIPVVPGVPTVTTSSESNETEPSDPGTSALNAPEEDSDDTEAEGLDELESAFEVESVVEGE
jgi:hypothetical protein